MNALSARLPGWMAKMLAVLRGTPASPVPGPGAPVEVEPPPQKPVYVVERLAEGGGWREIGRFMDHANAMYMAGRIDRQGYDTRVTELRG